MGVCAEEAEVLWGRWEHVDAALRRPEATALAVGPAGLQWHPGFQGVSSTKLWLVLHQRWLALRSLRNEVSESDPAGAV